MRQSAVLNEADAAVKGLEHAIARDREELAALEIANVTEHDVRELESTVATNADRRSTLEKSVAKHHEELIRLDERLNKATQDVADRASELEDAEGSWRPEQDRWERLQTNADEHRVLAATLSQRFASLFAGQGSANLRSTARQHVATLKERLSKARESEQTLEAVQTLLGSQELSGDVYLQAWLSVRDWLRQRIPAQLAETNEPVEALGRLRDHLAALQTKLTRQESDLRGESEDVARNIDIHIRRAQRQVSRLNDDLQSVRFGSIRGVRLRLERVERMGQVLDALRQGEGDGLFQPETPIEDALDELFRRHGGGKLGGQRLLDYREYVDPRVEVRRQEDVEWELVNPNRLSTGEGIGIGAALMMVVLTSWERDANLLRPKRSHGALRLLFLDEANRLDRENLGVLFDLCDSLQLQLLLAAPEVARAEGNTTYRLVRRVGSDGHDEVIVTGRRVARSDEKLPSPS
jgi:chromosome partition protein MukB